MNLSSTYMGFELPHPIIPGACPLTDSLDSVRQLEDAGAPLIIMPSLFEEQIVQEEMAINQAMEFPDESFPEALSYFPHPADFNLGPADYLEQLGRIKSAVSIPVIASLNGTTEGGWLNYAQYIQNAGADGLELNIYELPTNLDETGEEIENRALRIVHAVKNEVSIPVAVKLSPFYSSPANFISQLDTLDVAAVVLFNRFYQPDIDVEQLEVTRINLSSSAELLLRLRWLAVVSGRVRTSLGATGGVHTVIDVIKAVMAGAHGVQMVSALLRNGPAYLQKVRDALAQWLEEHEYESLRQMQGSMNLMRCSDPKAYERANYMKILHSWEV